MRLVMLFLYSLKKSTCISVYSLVIDNRNERVISFTCLQGANFEPNCLPTFKDFDFLFNLSFFCGYAQKAFQYSLWHRRGWFPMFELKFKIINCGLSAWSYATLTKIGPTVKSGFSWKIGFIISALCLCTIFILFRAIRVKCWVCCCHCEKINVLGVQTLSIIIIIPVVFSCFCVLPLTRGFAVFKSKHRPFLLKPALWLAERGALLPYMDQWIKSTS